MLRKKDPLKFIVLFILIGFSVFSNEPFSFQKYLSSLIWEDDFEDELNLNTKYEDVSINGLSVTQEDAFDGKYSLEQKYTQGQVDAGWICKVNNQGYPDHIFMRWYHKFEDGFEGFPPKMARIRHRDRQTWKTSYAVHCWITNEGEVVLDVSAKNSSQANSAGYLPIARSGFKLNENTGNWVCFEMEVKLNSPETKDGLYRLWINDELRIERLNVDLRGNTSEKINELMLDCYWNNGSPRAQSRFYDDFVISENKIGMKSGIPTNVNGPSTSRNLSILHQNFPNPFHSTTSINYSISGSEHVLIKVYDITGNEITTLVNGKKLTGNYTTDWNGTDYAGRQVISGLYFYKLLIQSESGNNLIKSKKMFLKR
mgnify:CR=1 FL=1